MQYLFQVSIGPVQDFIAAARRTRDLKFGSELLSELSKAAANFIATKYGINSLIFPAPSDSRFLASKPERSFQNFNVANKIVALIEEDSPEALRKAVEKVREAVIARLREIREDTYKQIGSFDKATANAQIDDLVEFFSVALPYDSKGYKGIREKVEALMAARKNTRDFSPVTWGSRQDKSSIDGQLESVIPNSRYAQRGDASQRREDADYLYSYFGAKVGERLSGVDLLKRNGRLPTGESFPSTSHFATIPFLERLEKANLDSNVVTQLKQSWNDYIQKIRDIPARIERMPDSLPLHPIVGKCEGSMLFEERFSDLAYINDDMNKFEGARKTLREFFKQVDEQFQGVSPKVHPGTYYAILLADGDSMGKVIDHEAGRGTGRHQELSRKLAQFSENVRSVVEHHDGWLIYTGGDDVLAFMPLHSVIGCARNLSEAFYNALKDFKDKDGKSPTLSVGVAVIHHLEPLREALQLARDAEKSAKHVTDKNALAITISKRSGSDFTIKGQWPDWKQETPQSPVRFADHLKELIDFCRQESIPHGTAHELRDMALRLKGQADTSEDDSNTAKNDSQKDQTEPTMQTVIKTEAKRILERKLTHHRRNNPNDNTKEAKTRHDRIAELLDQTNDVIGFANELIAAQFFADAMELAGLEKGL